MEEVFLIQASGNPKFSRSITLVKAKAPSAPADIDIELGEMQP